jgi:hypothetical protein
MISVNNLSLQFGKKTLTIAKDSYEIGQTVVFEKEIKHKKL